jgi:REP element-mobilizing transposase RayT
MIEEDDNPRHEGPWTDGYFAHTCGYFVEEHRLAYKKQPDGTATSYWECPVGLP